MFYYKIYGFIISSDYEFEEAVEVGKIDRPDIIIAEDEPDNPFYDAKPDDYDTFDGIYHRYLSAEAHIMYPHQITCIIKEGNTIKYRLCDNYNKLLVNEIFLCLVIPIALIQRKKIMIHGSGLVWNDRCFVVSGRSGSGKSTVTNALISKGAKFIADDTVALTVEDKVYADPAYPQQKLCPDQVTDEMKKKCPMVLLPEDEGVEKYGVRDKSRFYADRKVLDAIIILNPTNEVSEPVLEEKTAGDKLKIFIDNLYKTDTYKEMGIAPDFFAKCLEVLKQIKIYTLSRPLEGMTTEKQIECIAEKVINGF